MIRQKEKMGIQLPSNSHLKPTDVMEKRLKVWISCINLGIGIRYIGIGETIGWITIE